MLLKYIRHTFDECEMCGVAHSELMVSPHYLLRHLYVIILFIIILIAVIKYLSMTLLPVTLF